MQSEIAVNASRQSLYASLLALCASILLCRTIIMLVGGATGSLVPWVSALLVLEFVLDLVTLVGSLRWWINR